MNVVIFTDGGSKGNPGPAAIGIDAYLNDKPFFRYREDIGVKTNNEAEYMALLKALKLVNEKKQKQNLTIDLISCFADSQLMVSQMNGTYKIKQPHIQVFVDDIKKVIAQIQTKVTFSYVPREKNSIADALVNGKVEVFG